MAPFEGKDSKLYYNRLKDRLCFSACSGFFAAAFGIALLILVAILVHHNTPVLSTTCDDGKSWTNDYMTSMGCENRYVGNGVACTDQCNVGTGITATVNGVPVCVGVCRGACESEVETFYEPVIDETCPEINWSELMDNYTIAYPAYPENDTDEAYVLLPRCVMNICMYSAYVPTELMVPWIYAIYNKEEQTRICMSLVDDSYEYKNCLRVIPFWEMDSDFWQCNYVFQCAAYSTAVPVAELTPL